MSRSSRLILQMLDGMKAYLEAPDRTQDLLNIKWAWLSAGYSIGSTWHDTVTWPAFNDHWGARAMEQLQRCNCLFVISGTRGKEIPGLALMAGFALARGIRVFWIGAPFGALSQFREFTRFDAPQSFQRELLLTVYSKPVWAAESIPPE